MAPPILPKIVINHTSDGQVAFEVDDGLRQVRLTLDEASLSAIVSRLLQEAGHAMRAAKLKPDETAPVPGKLPGFAPTSIGLLHDPEKGSAALVVNAGRARVAVGIADPAELGRNLLAISAKPDAN